MENLNKLDIKYDLEPYREYLKNENQMDTEEIEPFLQQYLNLLMSLESVSEEILFISIGCSYGVQLEQCLPTYLKNIAEHKKVHAMLIDYDFDHHKKVSLVAALNAQKEKDSSVYKYMDNPNITIEIFGCILPNYGLVDIFLESAIRRVLDRGGRVFLANHTEAYALECIPGVGDVYNRVKSTHPLAVSGLQLYTQAGKGLVRCYLDKNYDEDRDKRSSSSVYNARQPSYSIHLECLPCLRDLGDMAEFTPNFQPTARVSAIDIEQNTRLKSESLLEESQKIKNKYKKNISGSGDEESSTSPSP